MIEWLIVSGGFGAMGLAVLRLLRGPTQADRIVALDVVFSCSVALCAAAALGSDRELFLDVAIGLSVVGFVATILWARLIDQSRQPRVSHAAASAPLAQQGGPGATRRN